MGPGQGPLRWHPCELLMFPAAAGGLGFGDNHLFLFRTHGQGLPFPPQQIGVFQGLPWLPVGCTAAGWTVALLGGAAAVSHLGKVGTGLPAVSGLGWSWPQVHCPLVR